MPSDPMPLLTFTMTGADERCSSGSMACVTRTSPKTFVSYTARMWSAVVSAGGRNPPGMPALLMSTSRWPTSASSNDAAALTEASEVTSSSM